MRDAAWNTQLMLSMEAENDHIPTAYMMAARSPVHNQSLCRFTHLSAYNYTGLSCLLPGYTPAAANLQLTLSAVHRTADTKWRHTMYNDSNNDSIQ